LTAGEWLACPAPEQMLEAVRGKASDRKLQLFAVAWLQRHGVRTPPGR
jgi:hypothetical protein